MSGKVAWLAGGMGVGMLGAVFTHRKMSRVLEQYSFVTDGLKFAGLEGSPVGYFKYVYLDDLNSVGNAKISVNGKTVRITANRKSFQKNADQNYLDSSLEDDDLEAEGSGLAFYWENPWEIKAMVIRGFKSGFQVLKNFITSNISLEENVSSPPNVQWELSSVIVDNDVLLGDLLMHPDFSSGEFQSVNGMKSEKSKSRAIYVLSFLAGTGLILGIRRGVINYRMWPTYQFAKTYIESNAAVKHFYNNRGIEVVARTGNFSRTKIESEITITGKQAASGTEAVVKFSASRTNFKTPWTVTQASMTPNGCNKPIDLLLG